MVVKEDKRDKVMKMLKQGCSTAEILSEVKCSNALVTMVRKDIGMTRSDVCKSKIPKIKKMLLDGYSYAKITSELQCSQALVRSARDELKEQGYVIKTFRRSTPKSRPESSRKDEVKEYLKQGLTYNEILEKVDCSKTLISNAAKEIGINRGQEISDQTQRQRVRLKELLEEGKSDKEIADELCLSVSHVSIMRRECGIKYRTANGERVAVDKGKIGALRRAGWKVRDIAYDVECDEDTVITVIAELGLK